MGKKGILRKRELVLIIIILLMAGVGFLIVHFLQSGQGDYVRITVDGNVYGDYPLDENRTIEVITNYGKNKVVILNGTAFVEEADCPDLFCVQHERISASNEIIVCLPHRLTVEIVEGDSIEKQ